MIGDKIKELRNRKGLYQQELADIMNVSKSTIAMWETNKREPSSEMLVALANFFECSTDYLMGRDVKLNLEETTTDELVILNRNAIKLSPEKQKQLLDMARLMFKEEFDDWFSGLWTSNKCSI